MLGKRVVVAIYIDPDFYPPTINAILNIAENFEEVIVISRCNSKEDFPFPANVQLKKVGSYCSVREMEKQATWKKLFYFLKFTSCYFREVKNKKTDLTLLYDHFALFAFYLTRKFINVKNSWYHNHDMIDKKLVSKFSISGLAAKFEEKAMARIRYFSLPSKERIQYFPAINAKLTVFIIPNYPSLKLYKFVTTQPQTESVKIIYQGFIGKGHALEEIIKLLPESIANYKLQLILKGSVTEAYRSNLNKLADELGVAAQLTWLPIGPYSEMPQITSSMNIGIGINKNQDPVSLAQGTASNKIYEYAASGLPVVLFDSEQFRKYLGKYEWALFSDGRANSLKDNILKIITDKEKLSMAARKDFKNELNFEKVFNPVLNKIINDFPAV